jgi:hypothetical protein
MKSKSQMKNMTVAKLRYNLGWKIQEDSFLEQRIEKCFGYSDEEVGKSSKWWFDKIHPEDSIKMSIKTLLFYRTKNRKWQDQYRFNANDSYKYVLDRGFFIKR